MLTVSKQTSNKQIMNKSNFLKLFVAVGLAFLMLTATSCHKGYGCPNQIEASAE